MLSEHVNKQIGTVIADRRRELNLSQQDLADKMGFKSATAISYIEAGLRDVRVMDLIRFAEVLEVEGIDFFLREPAGTKEQVVKLRADYKNANPDIHKSVSSFVAYVNSNKVVKKNYIKDL